MTELKARTVKNFWKKVNKTDSCWIWIAGKDSDGYGRFRVGDRVWLAHRVAYEMLVGEIPEKLELDHLCRVRECVNPEHLEPVTSFENCYRGFGVGSLNRVKTHCVNGHEFTEANTYYRSTGARSCRKCICIKTARYLKRKALNMHLLTVSIDQSSDAQSCR